MKKKILVTGANGQLGNEIRVLAEQYTAFEFMFTDVAELDICEYSEIESYLSDSALSFIINCAAYTAVDKAEGDVELCRKINAQAVANLGKAAQKRGAIVLHVSTDYVYSGMNYLPYKESDEPSPASVYGQTKLEGEQLLMQECPGSVILRTSWLYSEFGNNFVKTMLRLGRERNELGVVFDQVGTPTYALDLAKTLLDIAMHENITPGVYNYSNEGVCSWYDFTVAIHRIAGITDCNVKPIESIEYPTPAKRPHYSVMNKRKIKETFGIRIAHWEESLKVCTDNLEI